MNLQTLLERSERKLDDVHGLIVAKARELIKRCHAEGIYIQVTHGLRTHEEQNALYAKGRTTSGSKVTNARGGYSYHNFGLAVDYVVLHPNGSANWRVDSSWMRMGQIGESLGLEWGGNWRSLKDYPHFQVTFGLSTAQLRAGARPPVYNPRPSYEEANVTFEGKSVEALNIDGTVQLWTRDIAELLNVPVDFVNGHVVLNGITIPKEDVVLLDGKSFMHTRRIAEVLRLFIDWDNHSKTVLLSK